MYIYKTTNLLNNRIYIGQSTKAVEKSKRYFGSGVYFKKALKKYGTINFSKEILHNNVDSKKELDRLEELEISSYNSTDKQIGYNILKSSGGDMSGKNNGMYGKPSPVAKYSKELKSTLISLYMDTDWNIKKLSDIYKIPHSTVQKIVYNSERYKENKSNKQNNPTHGVRRKGSTYAVYGEDIIQDCIHLYIFHALKPRRIGELLTIPYNIVENFIYSSEQYKLIR